MDEINKIKYNRTVGKLNNYLNTLEFVRLDWLNELIYYDDHKEIININTSIEVIKIDNSLLKCNDEDIIIETIRKFIKHEDYSIRWKN